MNSSAQNLNFFPSYYTLESNEPECLNHFDLCEINPLHLGLQLKKIIQQKYFTRLWREPLCVFLVVNAKKYPIHSKVHHVQAQINNENFSRDSRTRFSSLTKPHPYADLCQHIFTQSSAAKENQRFNTVQYGQARWRVSSSYLQTRDHVLYIYMSLPIYIEVIRVITIIWR